VLGVYRAVAGIRMPVGSRPLDKIDSGRKPKDDWDDDEA